MVLAISRLEVLLLKLHDVRHSWAFANLLEEFLHNVIGTLSLALDLGEIFSVGYSDRWVVYLLCHM